jgi:ATP-dependent helicase/nuclease subunit B
VQVRFLLGPAGSGKTFRCLAEIRTALKRDPDGPPLILLAPKQATFQLERQLLATEEIAGFSRLFILSFDRLAQFVLERLNLAPPKLLSGEGRIMVLRALLFWYEKELQLFSRSARRPGFAQELGGLLAELQQHQFGPAKLRALAGNPNLRPELQGKLLDLALLAERYAGWLHEHALQDADCLLDFATTALRDKVRKNQHSTFDIQPSTLNFTDLWLDGFAEMTPQELDLLAAVVPFCQNATLAFCVEPATGNESSRLSLWSAISKTFQQCRGRLANLPDCQMAMVPLERDPLKSRFAGNRELAGLERNWPQPPRHDSSPGQTNEPTISITAAGDPEAEAGNAAREILKFVRAGQGTRRFRDCAVLVRNLEAYHQPLARALRRYDLPFFLDRRQSVAHHPLAELTRSALRTVAFDWRQDDWFAAVKAGFCRAPEETIDDLENAALAAGWRGKKWREPLPDEAAEAVRRQIIPPYERFYALLKKLEFKPTGKQLAELVRELWARLDVETILEQWSAAGDEASQIHLTVLSQMNLWLDNLALAFPGEALTLRDWLPVLDAGLANLTAGVVPPALDQVLVGAIDRARNPDLKFALVLGVNESVFPAPPAAPVILTDSDRNELEKQGALLGSNVLDQISREQYLGYIACTRASEKLALSFAHQGADGSPLNPSPFISRLQKIFPALSISEFSGHPDWRDAEHVSELARPLVELQNQAGTPEPGGDQTLVAPGWAELLTLPAVKQLAGALAALREPDERENLSPFLAEKLYGPVLRSSVSRLEEFAACPFKFFVRSGLHANERKQFELDARERGNFQHDVLNIFHEQLQKEGKRWRDVTPEQARERVGRIAQAQIEQFRDGLLRDSPEALFAARAMATALQDFVGIIVGWMHSQYEFDPVAAELAFGGDSGGDAAGAPAWEIELGAGHRLALQGRIDRVDLWRDPGTHTALAVVTDYKSGGKKLDSLLVANGIQLQLLGYLGALRSWKNPRKFFGVDKIIPAGAFYVGLRGRFESGDTRDEILSDLEAGKLAYRHNGRFNAGWLPRFDRRPEVKKGDQFNFRLNKDGGLPSRSPEALPADEFNALLELMETQLRRLGERIFAGHAEVDPYRKGQETPCEYCEYRAACRIDEWTHEYRELRAEPAAPEE